LGSKSQLKVPFKVSKYFNFAVDVVDQWAKNRNQLALHWVNQDMSTERKLTFFEISLASCRAANVLKSHGLNKGDRVLLILPRIVQWWELMVGITRLGAVPIPGTTQLTTKDIQYRIDCAKIKAVITDIAEIEKFAGIKAPGVKFFSVGGSAPGWIDYDSEAFAASDVFKGPKTKSTDPGILYFTSGTTGYPKMVLHSQVSYPLAHKITGQYWIGCGQHDVQWVLADTGWGLAVWGGLYGPWNCGACVFVHDSRSKFQAVEVLDCLKKYHITTLCAPPTVFRMMVLEDLSKYDFKYLKRCVSAGERLDEGVMSAWKKATGLTIYEGYGQTESVLMIGNLIGSKVKPGSMGKAAPGFDLAVVDENGKIVKHGVEGDLVIRVKPKRPVGFFHEYWNNPEENRMRFVKSWYYTQDRVKQDKDGYFWFVGRSDDVIVSASYRIGPFEVEAALADHPAVLEAAAIAKPDELRGAIVKAYCVLRKGYSPSPKLVKELQCHVKRVTAPYKYPREIEFIDALPKTINGKLRRVDLRKAEEAAYAAMMQK
jgi:acetyl-CoA synthetase/medium-chain acyl-CoA synthetase